MHRDEIVNLHGKLYIPKSQRIYKSKAANSQEAHEAIRPKEIPVILKLIKFLDSDQLKVYELIWKELFLHKCSLQNLMKHQLTFLILITLLHLELMAKLNFLVFMFIEKMKQIKFCQTY